MLFTNWVLFHYKLLEPVKSQYAVLPGAGTENRWFNNYSYLLSFVCLEQWSSDSVWRMYSFLLYVFHPVGCLVAASTWFYNKSCIKQYGMVIYIYWDLLYYNAVVWLTENAHHLAIAMGNSVPRRMVAIFDYDPRESSPNADVEVTLNLMHTRS